MTDQVTIHLVTSGKGNVGKSAFTDALICIAQNSNHRPIIVDADVVQKTISKLYGEAANLVVLSDDPALDSQPDRIFLFAEESTEGNKADIIVDLAAQTDSILNLWIDEKGILDLNDDLNIKVIKWWVSDHDMNNRAEIVKLCQTERYDRITHVLVKNYADIKPEVWESYIEQNSDLKQVLDNGKLKQIAFPRLSSDLVNKLRLANLTFKSVYDDIEHKSTRRLEQSTVIKWIDKCQLEIAAIHQFSVNVEEPKPPKAKKLIVKDKSETKSVAS